MTRFTFVLLVPFALAACEQLGMDDPVKAAERQEAEGRAVGGGCRHSGRSLEDCYAVNRRSSKAAIFAGWREMDGYMRENQIETAKGVPEDAAAPGKATGTTQGDAARAPDNSAPAGNPAERKTATSGKKAI